MTLDEKKKALDAYNNADYYTKGSYIDAQDTTNQFIMAKIVNVKGTDLRINYDGWSDKWDYVSNINHVDMINILIFIAFVKIDPNFCISFHRHTTRSRTRLHPSGPLPLATLVKNLLQSATHSMR